MISSAFVLLFIGILNGLPVISLPSGFMAALDFLKNVIGFINIFLPLSALLPIVLLIIALRNFNIIMAIVNWIIRLIPFVG